MHAAPSISRFATPLRGATGNRRFLFALLAITAGGLLLRLYVASQSYMSFDEWQQVFMASAPRWKDLNFELRAEAHPPLFYLLLKILLALGHSKLWYRSIAFIPGAGSVFLLGLIGRRLFHSAATALLCAATLALSAAGITISIEIRQYQLAVFLILLAFNPFVRICSSAEPVRRRDYAVFSIASALAASCHYSAILFVGGCFVTAVLWQILVARRHFRRAKWFAASLAVPSAVFALLYLTHGRRQPIQGYLFDFYLGLTPHEKLSGFLLRNIQNFGNLFSPVPISSRPVFLLLMCAAIAVAAFVLFRSRHSLGAAMLPVALAAVMVVELAALAIAKAYPFGGLLRHQYVVAPFLLLAAFVVIDRLAALCPPGVRPGLLVLVALMLVGNVLLQWPKLILLPNELMLSGEYNTYRAAFPAAQGVYLDHWGVVGYFIHTDDRRRRFVRRIADPAAIDQYDMEEPGRGTQIFYDKSRYLVDLTDPALYRSFAACLRQSGLTELTLFSFTPGDGPFRAPEGLRETIGKNAADHGLKATRIVIGMGTVFAGFELQR